MREELPWQGVVREGHVERAPDGEHDGDEQVIEREDPQHTTRIERAEPLVQRRVGGALREQDPADEKAGQDEEDRDALEAVPHERVQSRRLVPAVRVMDEDEGERHAAKPVEIAAARR